MKNWLLLLVMVFSCFFAACAGKETEQTNQLAEENKLAQSTAQEDFVFEIIVDGEHFKDTSDETLAENSTEDVNLSRNSDGTVSIKMSETAYQNYKSDIALVLEGICIEQNVKSNENFSQLTKIIDKTKYTSFDALGLEQLIFDALTFQTLSKVPEDQLKVVVNVQDEKTGETIAMQVFTNVNQLQ